MTSYDKCVSNQPTPVSTPKATYLVLGLGMILIGIVGITAALLRYLRY